MATNFTQFNTATPLTTSDFIVGYKADGSAEIKTRVQNIVNLVGESDSQTLSYNEVNKNLTISSGNTVSLSSLSDTAFATASSLFATNTSLQSTSALLTPFILTNTLTGQLVLNTDFDSYKTNIAFTTGGLLPFPNNESLEKQKNYPYNYSELKVLERRVCPLAFPHGCTVVNGKLYIVGSKLIVFNNPLNDLSDYNIIEGIVSNSVTYHEPTNSLLFPMTSGGTNVLKSYNLTTFTSSNIAIINRNLANTCITSDSTYAYVGVGGFVVRIRISDGNTLEIPTGSPGTVHTLLTTPDENYILGTTLGSSSIFFKIKTFDISIETLSLLPQISTPTDDAYLLGDHYFTADEFLRTGAQINWKEMTIEYFEAPNSWVVAGDGEYVYFGSNDGYILRRHIASKSTTRFNVDIPYNELVFINDVCFATVFSTGISTISKLKFTENLSWGNLKVLNEKSVLIQPPPNPSSATVIFHYNISNFTGYQSTGSSYRFRIYSYKNSDSGRVFSTNYTDTGVFTDNNVNGNMLVEIVWNEAKDADGYFIHRVGVNTGYYVINGMSLNLPSTAGISLPVFDNTPRMKYSSSIDFNENSIYLKNDLNFGDIVFDYTDLKSLTITNAGISAINGVYTYGESSPYEFPIENWHLNWTYIETLGTEFDTLYLSYFILTPELSSAFAVDYEDLRYIEIKNTGSSVFNGLWSYRDPETYYRFTECWYLGWDNYGGASYFILTPEVDTEFVSQNIYDDFNLDTNYVYLVEAVWDLDLLNLSSLVPYYKMLVTEWNSNLENPENPKINNWTVVSGASGTPDLTYIYAGQDIYKDFNLDANYVYLVQGYFNNTTSNFQFLTPYYKMSATEWEAEPKGNNWTQVSGVAPVPDSFYTYDGDFVNKVNETKIINWDTAYGWGNHAVQSYLKSISGESIGNLSNVNLSGIENGKFLVWNTDKFVVGIEGITETKVFDDKNDNTHTVVIKNGLITNWTTT
jgi:hypothetical protein